MDNNKGIIKEVGSITKYWAGGKQDAVLAVRKVPS